MTLSQKISPVLDFLRCRTPQAWLDSACRDRDALLLDHASLEFKAAQQAQKLIWKYAAKPNGLDPKFRFELLQKMSRLSREELRHFEQVVALLDSRGRPYRAVSASRYAATLHARVRREEPDALVDSLIIGAIIEARSCERFFSLLTVLQPLDPALATFYASLLKSEARHFEDYLRLARVIGGLAVNERAAQLLSCEATLISSPDTQLRFHSGLPEESV